MVRVISRGITIYRDSSGCQAGAVEPRGTGTAEARGSRTRGNRANRALSGFGDHGQAALVRKRSDVARGGHAGVALVVGWLVAVVGATGPTEEADRAAVRRDAVQDPLEVVLTHDHEPGPDVHRDGPVGVDPDREFLATAVPNAHRLSRPPSPR